MTNYVDVFVVPVPESNIEASPRFGGNMAHFRASRLRPTT
jgi:hypothetical protein